MSVVDLAKRVRISRASIDDIDHLLAIEEASFSVPWSRKAFEAELKGNEFSVILTARLSFDESSPVGLAGYVCIWLVFEELRFMTLAVNPAVRRQGIGTELVAQALEMGLARGTSRALLEVRQSNVSAQMLYQRFGFQPYGTRKAYYTNPNEDAILMALDPIAFPPTFTFHQRRDPMVTDEHIADHLRVANSEYREIEESHHRLDAELQELLKHHVLTPQEEILKKQIQKEKLGKKDRMAALIREYRSNQGQSAPV